MPSLWGIVGGQMHHALFPQNPQTATFCSYKDDNESAARWMSERERESHFPSPCSPAQQVVSSLRLVCLLALFRSIALNTKSKTDEARARTQSRIHAGLLVYIGKHLFLRAQLLPEELRDCGSCFSAAAAAQLNFRNRRMNK